MATTKQGTGGGFRNMPNISISLTIEQLKWLKRESYKLEISLAEYLRRLVDEVRLREDE